MPFYQSNYWKLVSYILRCSCHKGQPSRIRDLLHHAIVVALYPIQHKNQTLIQPYCRAGPNVLTATPPPSCKHVCDIVTSHPNVTSRVQVRLEQKSRLQQTVQEQSLLAVQCSPFVRQRSVVWY
eukprot:jgi/Chrzof1/8902/Cz03g28160.t1